MTRHDAQLALQAEAWDYTDCPNCGERVHRGDVDADDLCRDCHELEEEGLLDE